MVKYLGSKRTLVPAITAAVETLGVASAADVFTGTTRVAQALRRAGIRVHANDTATYSGALAQAYVVAGEDLDRTRIRRVLAELQALPGQPGYVSEVFCERARYFHPDNGARIDAIRERIDTLDLDAVERGVVLTSLLEAADRVDSTCGLQMAYLKRWAPRALRPLELREPAAVPGPAGAASTLDAGALAPLLDGIECAYLDPPYNNHSYFSNYHVWETLVRWDAPEHYGVACKRVDCRTTKSAYNSRARAWDALAGLVDALPTPWLVVSVSDEGFHDPDAVAALLGRRAHVAAVAVDAKRYVGAQIGIYNPRGERVGEVGRLRNTEWLFVAGPDAVRARAAAQAAATAAGGPAALAA